MKGFATRDRVWRRRLNPLRVGPGVGSPALALALLAVAPSPGAAQEVKVDVQLRPRIEYRTPVLGDPGREAFASTRARVQVEAKLADRLRGVAQLQDVRAWGDLPGTFPNAGKGRIDLHQGYLEAGAWDTDRLAVRAGRQEVAFGGERLIGAVDWAQQGRAFDGLRTHTRLGAARVDLFGFKVDDRAASVPHDGALVGSYATLDAGAGRSLDLFGLYNHVGAGARTDQGTVGARLAGTGKIAYRAEAAYQFGQRGGRDVSAYLLGGRVGTTVAGGKVGVTLWYDYLSGSAAPAEGKVRAFDTLFGTNHKYYGYADLFTNIPAHTAGHGLQDLALKTSYKVSDAVSVGVDLHTFHLARAGALPSGHLGEEVDLTAKWRLSPRLELVGGFSRVFGGDALRTLGRLDGKQTFSFVQLNTGF